MELEEEKKNNLKLSEENSNARTLLKKLRADNRKLETIKSNIVSVVSEGKPPNTAIEETEGLEGDSVYQPQKLQYHPPNINRTPAKYASKAR